MGEETKVNINRGNVDVIALQLMAQIRDELIKLNRHFEAKVTPSKKRRKK